MGNVFRRRRDAAAAVGALIGLLLCVGGPSAVAGSTVSLSDLEFEQVSGRLFELSVRVEGISTALSSTQIGFFYTEQRTRRHNLIEVATVMPIAVGDWLRPGVRWDTSELNPGLYKLRAVVMDDPGVSAENWEDEDAGTYRYVIVDQEGPGLIWPSEDISLRLKDEILCSMDWDKLDDNLRPNATLQSVWNLAAR